METVGEATVVVIRSPKMREWQRISNAAMVCPNAKYSPRENVVEMPFAQ